MALELFRKKSPDHLIAEAARPDRQMKRVLRPFALTCIGIGAIIGAIAGGGKGAAIGAAAGGGLGGGVQAATKGQQIKLPSETVLNFTLQAPLTVVATTKGPNEGRPKLVPNQ